MLANPKRTKDEIVQWIRSYFESNGPGCDAVVGISGGKDSSVVAALCVEALGKERVVGIMMPNGEQPDLDDSKQLIEFLGIRSFRQCASEIDGCPRQGGAGPAVSDQRRCARAGAAHRPHRQRDLRPAGRYMAGHRICPPIYF